MYHRLNRWFWYSHCHFSYSYTVSVVLIFSSQFIYRLFQHHSAVHRNSKSFRRPVCCGSTKAWNTEFGRLQNSPYFAYSSTRKQSNKRSGMRLKTESEPHTPVGRVRLATFARVRLLCHALPISLLILRKNPTVLQSNSCANFVASPLVHPARQNRHATQATRCLTTTLSFDIRCVGNKIHIVKSCTLRRVRKMIVRGTQSTKPIFIMILIFKIFASASKLFPGE